MQMNVTFAAPASETNRDPPNKRTYERFTILAYADVDASAVNPGKYLPHSFIHSALMLEGKPPKRGAKSTKLWHCTRDLKSHMSDYFPLCSNIVRMLFSLRLVRVETTLCIVPSVAMFC